MTGTTLKAPPPIPVPDEEIPSIYEVDPNNFEIVKVEVKPIPKKNPGDGDNNYSTSTVAYNHKGRKVDRFMIA